MKPLTLLTALMLLCTACAPAISLPERTVLRVMVYDSFSISEEVIAQFEAAHDVTVQFLQAGDTGAMLNQAILTRDNPQADVLYGVDNTFLSRALDADIFIPYPAASIVRVPEALHLDPEYRAIPVAYGDVCLNYDRDYFAEHDLPVPQRLADLTAPEYRGLLVVQNPASSSPGLAFLITTIGAFGEAGYLDFWADLRANDVLVVEGWSTAYYDEFRGGPRPLVVSYATSPAAEVYFSEAPLDIPPTGAIIAPDACFRQIEFAGILAGTAQRDLAEAFIDFLLDDAFQNDIPLQMWVYPASSTAELPSVFVEHALTAESPVSVPASAIEQHREQWIQAWTETVLR